GEPGVAIAGEWDRVHPIGWCVRSGVDDGEPTGTGRAEALIQIAIEHKDLPAGEDDTLRIAPDRDLGTGGAGQIVDSGNRVEIWVGHIGDRVVHERRTGSAGISRQGY